MKDLSIEKQIYLCKYHDVDTSLYTTLGLKEDEVEQILKRLKENGLYEQYRKMSEFEYERVIKNEKNKTKAEKILEKYKFDKARSYCERIKQVINLCDSVKNTTNFNLMNIMKKIAVQENTKAAIILNDCNRAISQTYTINKEIFSYSGYNKKPTLKEFIIKELDITIPDKEPSEAEENKEYKNQEQINEAEDIKSVENKILNVNEMTIQVPIKILYEYYYLKGFLDATEGNNLKCFE